MSQSSAVMVVASSIMKFILAQEKKFCDPSEVELELDCLAGDCEGDPAYGAAHAELQAAVTEKGKVYVADLQMFMAKVKSVEGTPSSTFLQPSTTNTLTAPGEPTREKATYS